MLVKITVTIEYDSDEQAKAFVATLLNTRTGADTPGQNTLSGAIASAVTHEQAKALCDHWQSERKRLRGASESLIIPPALMSSARIILGHAGGSLDVAKSAVTGFVEAKHDFWITRGHQLWILESHRDFQQALDASRKNPRAQDKARATGAALQLAAMEREAREAAGRRVTGGDDAAE